MRYAAVVGDPVAHSASPQLHLAAYRHLGLPYDYRRVRADKAAFRKMLADFDSECIGLSVTMPLKGEALAGVDFADGLAKVTGAVNTVIPSPTGLAGFNTDVYGIVQAVREVAVPGWRPRACAILGAGATAASALAASVELGAGTQTLFARAFAGPGRALAAAHRQGLNPDTVPLRDAARVGAKLSECDLVISTLPAGVADPLAANLRLGSEAVLLDVAYSPWPSRLAAAAKECQAVVVPGLRMLVHQAVMQVKLMTSQTVAAQVLAAGLEQAG